MSYETPKFPRNQVKRAGKILKSASNHTVEDVHYAHEVLVNWRAAHLYPINTFQANLRKSVKAIDSDALVAQRLKRTPSIVAKLQRFPNMQLGSMQDIGGLRAVVASISKLSSLRDKYLNNSRFKHELVSVNDYVTNPKKDGYRSIHFVYRYQNPRAPEYNGLMIELQLRTKAQHAWATAVETMGTYLKQALKSGQGDVNFRRFFELTSAALCFVEKTTLPEQFVSCTQVDLYRELQALDQELSVLNKLIGFNLASKFISERGQTGMFNLIILDVEAQTLKIRSFAKGDIEQANAAYAEVEESVLNGAALEAVLVAAGSISSLKKAYPNYFLDTRVFVKIIKDFLASGRKLERRMETEVSNLGSNS